MILDFKKVRPEWHLPPYPPYHKGHYLEEYFFNKYIEEKHKFDATGRTLIPIYWTSCYMQGIDVQPYIDALPKDKKYFTVSQHDDAIKEQLPEDTISFCAGGNNGGIPIPLICSPLQYPPVEIDLDKKDILCSFVGSMTHPVRQKMYETLKDRAGYEFVTKDWSINVNDKFLDTFIDITKRSKYTLCPRGYGAQSFRFYEAIQLGSVPVYIYDTPWLPFENEISYGLFSIVLHEKNLHMLPGILRHIPEDVYIKMLQKGREVYTNYFTMSTTYQQIYKYLYEDYNS